jgi:hypothetical protein
MAAMISTLVIPEIEGHIAHFIDIAFSHSEDHIDHTNENQKEED